jgi:trimeric autotransporter adhesin
MELYGSLSNISGSVTASAFTGSFIGDGSGLSGIQAAGVTGLNLSQISTGSISASLSPNGFNVNTDTSITGSVNITGSISLNGEPIGTGKLNETTFQAYTSSNDGRVSALETSSGSLNSFTSSINTTIKSKLDSDNVISGSVQVNITGTTGYSTFSSSISSSIGDISSSIATTTNNLSTSIASTDLSQTNRLVSIESKTGSYATTGSNLFIGTQTHSGSILPSVDNAYDLGSETFQWRDVYISSGSLYIDGTKVLSSTAQELTITTDTGQSIKILEGTTDSIILQTADGDIELKSSADGDILLDPTNGKIMLKGPIEVFNGNKIQSSVGGTPVVFANDIVVSGSIELIGTIDGIDLTAFSSSLNGRLGGVESSGGSLNEFTSSAIGRLNALETTTSSLNTYTSSNNTRLGVIEGTTSSLNTYTSSADGRLSSIETTTGSILSVNTTQNGRLDSLETTSGSILSANTTQNGRLDSIEGKTGSFATTGENIFQGNQTITGSLFVSQNLIIAGSSSIQNISSSVLNIADNIITVNAVNPSVRFGGLAVIDSGSSPQVSGSLLFDSVKNEWIFVHQNQGTVTSSVLLMGPETYDNLGNEAYITANRLVKSTGIEHLTNSNISDDGTTVTILSNAVVNGTFSATGTTLVSGSSQISHDSTTGYVANRHIDHTSVSISTGNGLSGGGDISTTRTLTLDTSSSTFTNGVKSKMNDDGVVSGSSQISFNGITDKPTLVSGSSQITYGSLSGIPSGIVSGSSQITFGSISGIPSGLVSGSSQIDLTATTNYSSGIKTRLNAEGVLSGSSQVVAALPAGTVSGSAQVSYTGLSNIPSGIVSGSSQITFGSISSIPSGLVSGSSQITFGSISSIPSGLVSGSSQITFGSISSIPSGLVSGSSQITFGSISSIPSGLVSGSSQITLSSTTGYSSVLNQAVLTSSSPTFADLYVNNWFRNNETNEGLYNQANGNHFYSTSGTDWVVTGSGGGVALQFRANHQSTVRGYVHGDTSSNFGLLDNTGNWQVRCNPSNAGGQLYNGWTISGNFVPTSNNSFNLGSSSVGWANIYTNDLHLSNMNKPQGNDIDGTNGNWTIQEGAENLYIINNNNGKKFKISLEEII